MKLQALKLLFVVAIAAVLLAVAATFDFFAAVGVAAAAIDVTF